jgi:hypothetical protein
MITRRCNFECPIAAKASVEGTSQQRDLEVAATAKASKYVAFALLG